MISVVIPCYNHGRWLAECVESVLAQTERAYQVIIADDASTDDSWEVAHGLAHSPVIAVRAHVHGGTAAALNLGIRLASGMLVAIVHADDLLEPWHLAELYQAAIEQPRAFVYGDLRFYVDGRRIARLAAADWDDERAKRKNLAHGAIMFPRRAWLEVGGYPEAMRDGREDWAMTLRLAHGGWPGYHVRQAEPSYLYRQHGDNRSLGNHGPGDSRRFREQVRAALPEVFG